MAGMLRARWRSLTGADDPPINNAGIESDAERALRIFGAPQPDHFPPPFHYVPPRPDRRAERERARAPYTVFLPGLLIGGLVGYTMTVDDPKALKSLPDRAYDMVFGSNHYINCAHARMSGAAPLHKGKPGYAKRLDSDGNGVACEPFFGDAAPEAHTTGAVNAKDRRSRN